MPPFNSRCAYLPENFLAYAGDPGCGAPLASPSSVMVGTVITGAGRKLFFQIVVLRLAFRQPEAPAVVMDHHADMIWVVERLRPSDRNGVVELPFRRGNLPNELRKLVAILLVTRSTAVSREVYWYHHWSSDRGGNGILLASRLRSDSRSPTPSLCTLGATTRPRRSPSARPNRNRR